MKVELFIIVCVVLLAVSIGAVLRHQIKTEDAEAEYTAKTVYSRTCIEGVLYIEQADKISIMLNKDGDVLNCGG